MKFSPLIIPFLIACIAACSNKSTIPPPDVPATDTSSAKVVYWLTTPDEQSLLQRMPALSFSGTTPAPVNISIDSTHAYQEMDGFGYTLTGGSASLMHQMPEQARKNLLNELFGNTDNSIRISYLRLSIGASDLSGEVYTYNDTPNNDADPDLSHFSIDKEKADLIPLLKEIISIYPSIKIIATPWTPPLWMKSNTNSVGGSLKPEFYASYAKYFVKYIQAMKEEGINITAITPQNEPLHDGNNPSLLMLATEQADFIKNHLGPAFHDAGISTKIIVYDHNCDKPDYPLTILNDNTAKSYVDGSAFHLYAGDISALSQVRNAHPDKNIYFTEQYTAGNGNFGGDLQWHIKNLVIGAPRNWSKTVFEWNLANDVNYGPHTPGGCTTCKGALTIDDGAVKRNVAYYIIAHISKFVPPGSVRISSDIVSNIQSVAFLTPSKQKVLIVLNEKSSASAFNIRLNGRQVTATIPSGAVASFVID